MKNRIKVALDVDGCCLNWFKRVCEVYQRPYRAEKWDVDWIKEHWSRIENNPACWVGLEALDYPNFEFDLYLTSIPEKWIYARKANLFSLDFPNKPVIVSYDKINYCLDKGIDLLIDDRPDTVIEAQEKGLKCIQVYPHYAQYPTVGTWVVEKISEIPSILEYETIRTV